MKYAVNYLVFGEDRCLSSCRDQGMSVCNKRFRLEVPNDTASIALIGDFVCNVARLTGFEDDDVANIRAAVAEAAHNVIHHAFAPGEEASFDVICEPTQLGLGIIISEMGMPFDPSRAECSLVTPEGVNTGREEKGICLMKRTMDEVSFHNLGKRGKETRLFKYLDTGVAGRCITKAEIEAAAKSKTGDELPKETVSYLVRRMDPLEAVEVSKCAYSAYHYSYFYEYMYYPEKVRRLNETGEFLSYVAVTPEREIMGHAALRSEKKRGVAELMAAFVRPEYRGQGCLNTLTEALIEEGRARGFSGLYVRAVTSHPYSQKAALKYGFSGSCLYLAQYDPLEFEELATGKRERESMLHAFLYLSRPAPFRIYPPPHHKEMVVRIYEGLDARPEAADEQTGSPQAVSSLRVIAEPYHTAKIEILEYGADLVPKVERSLKALCIDRIEAVYLSLDLCNPLTALITAEFEKMGFFFAGVNPGAPGTDLLVLQFLNNLAVDYDRLQFASEMGRQVAEYIRLRDPHGEKET
jgi:anti-sigma regulatory factor (Ser/Thr protein kinase)/GNAT superfamily N-acetyltransferase